MLPQPRREEKQVKDTDREDHQRASLRMERVGGEAHQ